MADRLAVVQAPDASRWTVFARGGRPPGAPRCGGAPLPTPPTGRGRWSAFCSCSAALLEGAGEPFCGVAGSVSGQFAEYVAHGPWLAPEERGEQGVDSGEEAFGGGLGCVLARGPGHRPVGRHRSPHAADVLRLDHEDHSYLVAAAEPGVGLAEVLLGQRVDVLGRAVGGDLDHPAAYLEVPRGARRVGDGESHARVAFDVPRLHV